MREASPIRRRGGLAALALIAAVLALPTAASANVPFKVIESSGPVGTIWVGNELSCQVKLNADEVFSFFPPDTAPGDCGTFLGVGGTVYAPDFANHDGDATPEELWTPFTPVAQSSVTGTGTAADPFTVVTEVAAGTTGLRVVERTTYVVGERGYSSEWTIFNDDPASQAVKLYHGGDCFLAGTDDGFGAVSTTTHGAFCTANPNNSPPGRVIGFTPTPTENTHYYEDLYSTVWGEIDGTDLPDACQCEVLQDNGAAIQWNLTIPAAVRRAAGQVTVSAGSTVDSGVPTTPPPPPPPPPAAGAPPETTITKGPKAKVAKKKAKFKFTASDPNAKFECKVDKKPYKPCTSPKTVKVDFGKHKFKVRASNEFGTDLTPAKDSWKRKPTP